MYCNLLFSKGLWLDSSCSFIRVVTNQGTLNNTVDNNAGLFLHPEELIFFIVASDKIN